MDFDSVQKRLQVLMEDALVADLEDESALHLLPTTIVAQSTAEKVQSGPNDGLDSNEEK